jgi:hypothetical protein
MAWLVRTVDQLFAEWDHVVLDGLGNNPAELRS